MRLLYYIHSLTIGGAETMVVNYLLALKDEGYEVTLVENTRSSSFLTDAIENAGIRIIDLLPSSICAGSLYGRLFNFYYYHFANYKKLWKPILDDVRPEIIHIHTSARLIRSIDFPANRIVYSFHSNVERCMKIFGYQNEQVLRRLVSGGATFFSLSTQMTKDIHAVFGTDKIVYIPNGIDIDRICESRCKKDELQEKLGIIGDAFLIGQVGRFDPVKNHEKTIGVFKEIIKIKENAYLIFIGKTGSESYKTVEHIVQADNKLREHVIFLGVSDEATKLMSAFDVLIHPSLNESFSLVVLEAQTLGIRCVVSTAVPEDVLCNENCISLDLSQSDSVWADAVLSTYSQKNHGNIEQFEMSTVIDSMKKAYGNIIESENKQ